MIIVQLNVPHAPATRLLCGAWLGGGTAARQREREREREREQKGSKTEREGNEMHTWNLI